MQHQGANPNFSILHMATQHGNVHAAIPLRSAPSDSTSAQNYAHTHTQRTIHCRTQKRHQFVSGSTATPHPHTGHLSSRAAATLHGKPQGLVWCPGFLPNTTSPQNPPQHKSSATITQPVQCVFATTDVKTFHNPPSLQRIALRRKHYTTLHYIVIIVM